MLDRENLAFLFTSRLFFLTISSVLVQVFQDTLTALGKHLWEKMEKETGKTGEAIRLQSVCDPVWRREEGRLGGSGLDSHKSAEWSGCLWAKVDHQRGLTTSKYGPASVFLLHSITSWEQFIGSLVLAPTKW